MPRTLRVAKLREASKIVENDLRGLGHNSLFQDLTPLPVLRVKGELDLGDPLLAALGLNLSQDSKTDLICPSMQLTYKEKSLRLFGYAMHLRRSRGTDCFLFENRRYHKALKEALSEPVHQEIETFEQLTIDPAIQLYLAQTGFSIHPTDEKQYFTAAQLNRFWGEFMQLAPDELRHSHEAA